MNYALTDNMNRWLRHPAMGDPSFDTFEKVGPTVHRSDYPYEWAVNGSLYTDRDGAWYLYAGLYPYGYMDRPGCVSHFEIYRSLDRGQTWTWLGEGLDRGYRFEGVEAPSSSCPDVVLFYDRRRGKYLLTYDWSTDNSTWAIAHDYTGSAADAGAAVAWADSPAGPFERIPQTVFRNTALTGKYGRFNRFYATTVLPREHDYLALMLCDTGPNFAWGLAGCTAVTPEEGFCEPRMLLSADRDEYYPAPMEFYPAFVVDGTVYAPATSVCANRNYQVVFAAPLEQAHLPSAWRLIQDGSVWHARPLSDERYGLFGQTINGMVDGSGAFNVMYASKDERGHGTLSVASRPWDKPFSDGFTLSGHAAPSVTLLRDAFGAFELEADFELHGGFCDFLFDFHGKVGAESPVSDCPPNGSSLTRYTALRISGAVYSLVKDDGLILTGRAAEDIRSIRLARTDDRLCAWADREKLFDIEWGGSDFAPIGIRTDKFTVVNVSRFEVTGDSRQAVFRYNDADALLGGGVGDINFAVENGFRRGRARVKWNAVLSGFTLWGRRAPGLGRARVIVDGNDAGVAIFSGESPDEGEIFRCDGLPYGPHGIALVPIDGEIIVPDMIAKV